MTMNASGTGESQGLNPELRSVSRASAGDVYIGINPSQGSGGSSSSGGSEKKPASVSVGQLDYRLDKTAGRIETAITKDGEKTRQKVESITGDLASISDDVEQIATNTGNTQSVLESTVVPTLEHTSDKVDAISDTLDTTSEGVARIESILEDIKNQGGELTPEKITEIVKANPGITEEQLAQAIKNSEVNVTAFVTKAANALIQETRQGTAKTAAALSQESQVLKDKIDQLNRQIDTANGENKKLLIAQAEQSRLQFEALTAEIKSLEAQTVVSQKTDILRGPGLVALAKKDAVFGLILGQAIARIEAGEDADTVVEEIKKEIEIHDPQRIEARAMANAGNVGNTDVVSGDLITLASLETENPTLRDKIRAQALTELTKGLLNENLSPDEVATRVIEMANNGTIDQSMSLEILDKYRGDSVSRARNLISQYESGIIPSIEELEKMASMIPEKSLARTMLETRIQQDREMIDWNKIDHTLDEQIEHTVENLPEPQRTIHKNILESAQNQQKLKRETLAAETKAIEAEENVRKQAEIEKTLRKLWIIARVGGPILTLALLGAAGGVGFGAVAGSFGVGASGFLIGGAIGAGAGVLIGGRYGFEHGFADWRKLNTLSARSAANIAKLRENAGALEGQIDVSELNVANLVADTAIQQEIQKRGLKSQADIQALRNQMLTQLGADLSQQKGLRQATAAIFSMRTA